MRRTHTCGELRADDAGSDVTLSGWVDSLRLSGKIGFLILRDRYGTTQCFLGKDIVDDLPDIRRESVVQVTGSVKERPDNQKKDDMKTGDVEVSASSVEVLSAAEPLPLELDEHTTDETRLEYRFLDLRRQRLQDNLALRSDVKKAMRDFLHERGFLELETPNLAKSTPEGARDFLVPSRNNKGKFYALPQSPQLFKQLFMIAGYDKYYQIARCFRDEDLRADRQPEFTQLDVEMSFVEEEDVIGLFEDLMQYIWAEVLDEELETPFPRISYDDAMDEYGTDAPNIGDGDWNFCWVVDFPMFEETDDGDLTYSHHPFTMPEFDTIEDITSKPRSLQSKGYDLVLNGHEIGGGSIRIHRRDIQEAVLEALGMDEETYMDKFGFFLNALQYGTPPHGGIAFGMDRLCALMSGEESIREVIAFPKNKDAEDMMLGSPSDVDDEQLDELGIQTR